MSRPPSGVLWPPVRSDSSSGPTIYFSEPGGSVSAYTRVAATGPTLQAVDGKFVLANPTPDGANWVRPEVLGDHIQLLRFHTPKAYWSGGKYWAVGLMLKYIDANNHLYVYIFDNGNNNADSSLGAGMRILAGSWATFGSTWNLTQNMKLENDKDYWLMAAVTGDLVQGWLLRRDPFVSGFLDVVPINGAHGFPPLPKGGLASSTSQRALFDYRMTDAEAAVFNKPAKTAISLAAQDQTAWWSDHKAVSAIP